MTWNRSPNASRPFTVTRRGCEGNGRTWVFIRCPFCGSETKAYVWSLSGGGKVCAGGDAKFASFGDAFPREGAEDA